MRFIDKFNVIFVILNLNYFSLGNFYSNNLEATGDVNECNVINDEYCVYKPFSDDCASTIIYPYTCANQLDDSSCDFFLDWNTLDKHVVKFSLSKYNYTNNEWIAMIFSQSNITNSEIESDIIISMLPSNSHPKIVNGIIRGSDVILIEDLQEPDSNLFSVTEKKLLSEKITLNEKSVDIEFSFKFSSNNSINLNKCSKSNPNEGYYIFLMSGQLDNKNNILFETATIPKILGPFCLESCSSKRLEYFKKIQIPRISNFSSKVANENSSTSNTEPSEFSTELDTSTLTSTITPFTPTASITTSSSTSSTTSSSTTTTSTTTIPSTTTPTTTTSTSTNTTNVTSTTKTTTATTTTTTTTISAPTPISTTNTTTTTTTSAPTPISTTNTTTTTLVSSTYSTSTIKTTSETTTRLIITTETTEATTTQVSREMTFQDETILSTIASSLTSPNYIQFTTQIELCSSTISAVPNNKDFKWIIETYYDHTTKRMNYKVFFTSSLDDWRMGIFINNPATKNEFLIVVAEVNQTLNSIDINLNGSESIQGSINNENIITFSIPRNSELPNKVDMRDCVDFKFYLSDKLNIEKGVFLKNLDLNSLVVSELNSVCIKSCNFIEKSSFEIYLKFRLNNYEYNSDYNDMKSNKTLSLSKKLILILSTILNNQFFYKDFEIVRIFKATSNQKRLWLRQLTGTLSSGLIIESSLTVLSQNSENFTKNGVLNQLNRNIANFSTLMPITGFSLIDNFSNETSALIQTTTIKPIDTNYPKVLALALVFSLLGTVLVFGGALYAYHRWRKSKTEGNTSNGGIRFAIPNRRAKYESQMVRLDGVPDNNYSNDDFDLQFTNPGFDENFMENNNLTYTDFTGSREVGIDVGALEDNFVKQPTIFETQNEKDEGLKNLRAILNESILSDKKKLIEDNRLSSEEDEKPQNLYRANNFENLNIQGDDDGMNFDYFEEYKKTNTISEKTDISQSLVESINHKSEKFKDDKSVDLSIKSDEKTEDVADIFSKEIERNLPELFGEYITKEKVELNKKEEKQLDDESLEGEQKDSLSISSHEPSDDEEDYKPIDKNAFKNFRIESNINFVHDDSKSSLKELFKKQNENKWQDEMKTSTNSHALIDLNNTQTNEFKDDSKLNNYKKDLDNLFSSGIAEFSTPRVCTIKIQQNQTDLGIHLCDSKNHMIKDVEKESAADRGGIKPGDKILIINSENVEKSSYEEVLNKLNQAVINSYNSEIKIVVMNAIEYNIFKSNENNLISSQKYSSNDNKDLNEDLFGSKVFNETDTVESSYGFNLQKAQAEMEFNPFDDIPNEMFTPFLHYSSIPPPTTFQISEAGKIYDQFDLNIKDDSLEESTSETISSSLDNNHKKDASFNNANDFDFDFNFNSNFTSTTNVNSDTNQNPSINLFGDVKETRMPWITNSTHSEFSLDNNNSKRHSNTSPDTNKIF